MGITGLPPPRWLGMKEVPVNIVDDIAGRLRAPFTIPVLVCTVQEVVEDAATVGANNIRIKGKRVAPTSAVINDYFGGKTRRAHRRILRRRS